MRRRSWAKGYIPKIGEIDRFPTEFYAVLAKCNDEWIVMYNMGDGVFMDEYGRYWVFSEKKWYEGDLCPFYLVDETAMFMQGKEYISVFLTNEPWI